MIVVATLRGTAYPEYARCDALREVGLVALAPPVYSVVLGCTVTGDHELHEHEQNGVVVVRWHEADPVPVDDLVTVCRPCMQGRHHACGAPGRCHCTINPDTGEDEHVDDV